MVPQKKKVFHFWPHYFTIQLLTSYMKMFVSVYRLSRSCSVTYWGISVDVKICGKPFREIVFFAFHQYLTTNFHLNIFLLGIIFLSSYLLLEMMCRYILFQIFNKLYLFLFFADVYAMQERSHNISHLQ